MKQRTKFRYEKPAAMTMEQLQAAAHQALVKHADVIAAIKCYDGIGDLNIYPMFYVTLQDGYRNAHHGLYETTFHCAPDRLDDFLDRLIVGKFTVCNWSIMDGLELTYFETLQNSDSAAIACGQTVDGYDVILIAVHSGKNITLQLQTTRPQ